MQAQNSQLCIYCDHSLQTSEMKYLLSDMGVEMLAWMELKLKREVNDQSCLCENCFTLLGNTWSQIQEPEVMDFSESTAMEHDPDPLLVNRLLMAEEVNIKTEDEPDSFEHYDFKVEIDTSQSVGPQQDEAKTESDLEHEEECVDDQKKISDDDYGPDIEELSSGDEAVKKMLSVPPLLDGASLRSGSKCDSCSTLLAKQTYRKLPDGPEKDFFVVNEKRARDVSPERVCNPCFLKAHAAVVKQYNKVDEKSSNAARNSPVSPATFVIPSYRRFAKSSRSCIIRNCKKSDRLHVPHYLRVYLLKHYNIYTSDHSRVCHQHSKEYIRDWSFLKKCQYMTELSAEDVTEMVDLLREEALKHPD